MNPLKEHALAYAAREWPVFPLVPANKHPLTAHGFKDATTDPVQIERWWTATPAANIGIRTGIAFDVLDVDGPEGHAHLETFAPDYFHNGPVSYTGKGWHYLFQPTTHPTIHGSTTKFVPKVDFQSANAYIVAPPSLHPNGHTYNWDAIRGPNTALPVLPEWLSNLLDTTRPIAAPPVVKYRSDIWGNLTPIATPYEMTRPPVLDIAVLLGLPVKRVGSHFLTNCLFHEDSTPSLELYPAENTFWCHGCRVGGDSHQLKGKKYGYRR